jgi:ActR/RegA family two-component response regulator
MRRVLLIDRSDGTAEELKTAMLRRGFKVRAEDQRLRAAQLLRQPVPEWEFVVIVARSSREDDVTLLRELVVASQQFQQSDAPQFIFASSLRCISSLRIRIAKLGARYVRL